MDITNARMEGPMNINNVSVSQVASTYQSTTTTKDTNTTTTSTNSSGAVYEPNPELVAKLQNQAAQQAASLQSLVEKVLLQQSNLSGQSGSLLDILSSGNFTVDAQTKADAQAAISEDGYWGVEQTSTRIVDFATALTGGDPDKIEEMRAAFQKGYEQAAKKWGGELPEISQQTYDAVMAKFDALTASAAE